MSTTLEAAALPQLLTVPQVCDRLGIRKSKAYDLLNSGRLRSVRLDGARRIPADALTAFVAGLNGGEFQPR